MQKKNIITIIIILLGVSSILISNKTDDIKNKYDASQFANDSVILESSDKIVIEKDGVLTCTGMTYDSVHDVFYIGNYGKETSEDTIQNASIIVCDKNFNIINEIMLPDNIENIQGVTYSEKTDSIYYTDTFKIYQIDLEGNQLKVIDLKQYEKYNPNSLLYDDRDDTLWVLCAYEYLLHIDVDGMIIDRIECSYKDQDQICFDDDRNILFTVGADYNGNKNYVGLIDIDKREIKILYNVLDSYAVEGIYMNDGKMLIVNDGIFHDATIKNNYVSEYVID